MSLADLPLYLNDERIDDMTLLRLYVDEHSQDAFAQLVERHASWIRSVCRRSLRDREYADDATQLVFIILARKASQLSENTRVSGWLYRTTRFVLSDMRKREMRRRRRHTMAVRAAIERSGDGVFAYDPASQNGARETVAQIMAMLPEHERQAIAMHFFDGLTFREIGEALGLSRDGAKKRVARALARLRNGNALKGFIAAIATALATTLKAPSAAKAAVMLAGKSLASPATLLRTLGQQLSANLAKLTAIRAATATVVLASAVIYTVEDQSHSKRAVASRDISDAPRAFVSSHRPGGPITPPITPAGPVSLRLPAGGQQILLANNNPVMQQIALPQRSATMIWQTNANNASAARASTETYVTPPTVERHVSDRFNSNSAFMGQTHSSGRSDTSRSDKGDGKTDAGQDDDRRVADAPVKAVPANHHADDAGASAGDQVAIATPTSSSPSITQIRSGGSGLQSITQPAGQSDAVGADGALSTGGDRVGTPIADSSRIGQILAGDHILSVRQNPNGSTTILSSSGTSDSSGIALAGHQSDHQVGGHQSLEHVMGLDSNGADGHTSGHTTLGHQQAGDGQNASNEIDARGTDSRGSHTTKGSGQGTGQSNLHGTNGHHGGGTGTGNGVADASAGKSGGNSVGSGASGDSSGGSYDTLGLTDKPDDGDSDPDDTVSVVLPPIRVDEPAVRDWTPGRAALVNPAEESTAGMIMMLLELDPSAEASTGQSITGQSASASAGLAPGTTTSEVISAVLGARYSSDGSFANHTTALFAGFDADEAGDSAPSAVPEPASVISLGACAAGLFMRRRRRS